MKSAKFVEAAETFTKKDICKEEIIKAGEMALVKMFGGGINDDLDNLRLKKFKEKVMTNRTHVEPQQLPPTSAAGKFHNLRVYHQVQTWLGNELEAIN